MSYTTKSIFEKQVCSEKICMTLEDIQKLERTLMTLYHLYDLNTRDKKIWINHELITDMIWIMNGLFQDPEHGEFYKRQFSTSFIDLIQHLNLYQVMNRITYIKQQKQKTLSKHKVYKYHTSNINKRSILRKNNIDKYHVSSVNKRSILRKDNSSKKIRFASKGIFHRTVPSIQYKNVTYDGKSVSALLQLLNSEINRFLVLMYRCIYPDLDIKNLEQIYSNLTNIPENILEQYTDNQSKNFKTEYLDKFNQYFKPTLEATECPIADGSRDQFLADPDHPYWCDYLLTKKAGYKPEQNRTIFNILGYNDIEELETILNIYIQMLDQVYNQNRIDSTFVYSLFHKIAENKDTFDIVFNNDFIYSILQPRIKRHYHSKDRIVSCNYYNVKKKNGQVIHFDTVCYTCDYLAALIRLIRYFTEFFFTAIQPPSPEEIQESINNFLNFNNDYLDTRFSKGYRKLEKYIPLIYDNNIVEQFIEYFRRYKDPRYNEPIRVYYDITGRY